jgi:hypothetical protein
MHLGLRKASRVPLWVDIRAWEREPLLSAGIKGFGGIGSEWSPFPVTGRSPVTLGGNEANTGKSKTERRVKDQ